MPTRSSASPMRNPSRLCVFSMLANSALKSTSSRVITMSRPTLFTTVQSLLLVLLFFWAIAPAEMMTEDDRRAEYAARGYQWPIPDAQIQPNTPGWTQLMKNRLRQIQATSNEKRDAKYDGWKSAMSQTIVVPNFTQYGWAVTRGPADLIEEIQVALRNNFDGATKEGFDPCIVGGDEPVMVDIGHLVDKALHQMQPYLESWTGIPLKPIKGYGLRIYFNNSRLYMHLDKTETHVISCIIHIDRSIDYQRGSFPLVIEDFEGTTQHVYLDCGDVFMYESAKCLHGRPIPLNGTWFTSLFLHYVPQDWPMERQNLEAQYAIPDHWEEVLPLANTDEDHLPYLTMVDTAMIEPDCPNNWCGSSRIDSWEGPAKLGAAISSHGSEQPLSVGEAMRINDEL